jgi:rhodanese-related sulfurtransferase
VNYADTPPAGSHSIDEILAAARTRLHRIQPVQAHHAQRTGANLVDIRPAAQRQAHGEIPGAITIERNVLEWRLDPRSDARLPIADRYDLPVVIVCQDGYTSSLAAAALHDLGLNKATDMIGGFTAWAADGLPVITSCQMG